LLEAIQDQTTVHDVVGVLFALRLVDYEARGRSEDQWQTDEGLPLREPFDGAWLPVGLGMGADIFGTVMERSGYLVGFTACALTGLLLAGLDALLRARPIRRPKPASLLNRLPRLSTRTAPVCHG
jgi:hypothetical protein